MFTLIDIETIPRQDIEPPEFDVATVKIGNLKDPDKIEAKIARAREEYLAELDKKMATNPELCQIVCAAWAIIDEGKQVEINYKWFNQNESRGDRKEDIQSIVDILNLGNTLITWNGKGFDLPVLWKRAIFHELPWFLPNYLNLTKKYDAERHIDLMQIWSGWGYAKMQDCAKFLGIPCQEDFDGSMVYEAWLSYDSQKIIDHNIEDIETMYEICRRLYVF